VSAKNWFNVGLLISERNDGKLTMRFETLAILTALTSFGSTAFAADSSACMDCHDDGEFSGMSAANIVAAVKDTSIPPHKRFAELSDADLQAIVEEFAGS
jgi:hypothetical protein